MRPGAHRWYIFGARGSSVAFQYSSLSHLNALASARAHICTLSYLHVLISARPHICTLSYLHALASDISRMYKPLSHQISLTCPGRRTRVLTDAELCNIGWGSTDLVRLGFFMRCRKQPSQVVAFDRPRPVRVGCFKDFNILVTWTYF